MCLLPGSHLPQNVDALKIITFLLLLTTSLVLLRAERIRKIVWDLLDEKAPPRSVWILPAVHDLEEAGRLYC
jgi:hypothetical protein